MKITAPQAAKLPKTPLLVLLACEGAKVSAPVGVKLPAGFLKSFGGAARSTATSWASAGPAERVLLIGLGPKGKVDAESFRRAGAIAARQAEAGGVSKASLWVDGSWLKCLEDEERTGRSLAEGAVMGAWRYDGGKSKKKATSCKAVEFVGGSAAFRRGAKRGHALGEANLFTRVLQVRPGNEMTPSAMAAEARKLARRSSQISCRVLDERQMKEMGMGLLLGVSQGSTQPARLIHLTYKPKKKARGRVCFVGKGLTFDAGGISIKPSGKMDEMRYDMSGGAAVLGVFHALADVDVPFEVHGVVPSSENLIDGCATKPGDIHKAMNGTTVEVLNTDAEGRLILADALCYVAKKVKPDTIVDLATLTGAVIVVLGHELTAIYPSTDKLRDDLVAAGESTGELCWPMPLLDLHRDAMKGQVADLTNISSPAVGAGSVTGAAFLSHFVEEGVAWCHMDIAGTAWNTAARDWVGGAQGSGVGTRLLMEYLETRR